MGVVILTQLRIQSKQGHYGRPEHVVAKALAAAVALLISIGVIGFTLFLLPR
jgi:hypothetical protein